MANYYFVPKHTIGSQLLDVRRDKREREAYEASRNGEESDESDYNTGKEEDCER